MTSPPHPPQPDYEFDTSLSGPTDAVLSLAFSAQGKFICASGTNFCCSDSAYKMNLRLSGYNGAACWDLTTNEPMPPGDPTWSFGPRGVQVFPLCTWGFFKKTSRHVLFLGSQNGTVKAWAWNTEENVCPVETRCQPTCVLTHCVEV